MAGLSPAARAAALAALPTADLDVLVVGGGITGVGIARDAALRGLSVALLEAVDFAAGTSSRSSKLIHGGVRYLQQGDLGLVREAASERARLRRIAPHLATPLLMVMPTYGRGMHLKLGAGLWTFEKIAAVDASERHAMWSRTEALTEEPCLAADRLHGAAAFVEYLTDDARLVLATVAGAVAAGALCANHVEVTRIDRGAITARDVLSDAVVTARARVVVNAAGPWVEEIWRRAGTTAGRGLQLTKGIHLVVDHARLPLRHAVVMQARDRRSVFAVPRDGVTYIGTTDTLFDAPALHPAITADDVDYLLDAARRTFAGPPLERSDVLASWVGLRPLLREEGKAPSEISRKDEIAVDPASGLISIAGGKLTTARRMAERVVDLVFDRLGRTRPPCPTDSVPLPGGEPTALDPGRLAARLPQLSATEAARMFRLHGGGCERILARVAERPAAGEMVPGLPGVLRAEIEHALDDEMALTLEDLLERRTRSLSFDRHQGLEGVEAAATIAAERLGWDARRTEGEIAAYRRLAASLRSFV
jgi:glycerol-3-phosphate dehydrogenase